MVSDLLIGLSKWFGKTSSDIWNLVSYVWSGSCRGNIIVALLKIVRAQSVSRNPCNLGLCLIGLRSQKNVEKELAPCAHAVYKGCYKII